MKIILVYIPVIHRGYLNFFDRHEDADRIGVLGDDLLSDFEFLRKDIRALSPSEAVLALRSLRLPQSKIWKISRQELDLLKSDPAITFMVPNDEVMRQLVRGFEHRVIFDTTFLRWDRKNSLEVKEIVSEHTLSQDEMPREFLRKAEKEAEKTSDFWRSVGAVLLLSGGDIISSHNRHVPTEYEPYFNGDPRGNFKRGLNIEISTALHAEADVIAQAARMGLSVEDSELYVTTFPCPPCAKLVAYSGVKKLFYKDSYSVLDGESILRSQNVEIFRVT